METPANQIDAWFSSLEGFFLGRLPDCHPLIGRYEGRAWRGRMLGETVIFLIDRHFPYTKPQAFIENYDIKRPKPHVEPMPGIAGVARLCLQTSTIPNNPVAAIESAFVAARHLLKAIDAGTEDHDFDRDFDAYWRHYLPAGSREVKLHGRMEIGVGSGFCIYKSNSYFCFSNKASIRRWYSHAVSDYLRDTLEFPIIELARLPKPDRFPEDVESFVTFLRRYTVNGTMIAASFLRRCPSRLPIIFSGPRPDGGQVEVAVELVRRDNPKGRPLKKAKTQAALSDHEVITLYDFYPLNTCRLDAALSRVPDLVTQALEKKVLIVGCGALGSGVAVMLAKAGVSHLILVDHDRLGWENIRRHELGAEYVGHVKSSALRKKIEKSIPDIKQVDAYECSIQRLLESNPAACNGVDLIISATGDWGADVFIGDGACRNAESPPVLYCWMEAYALASHSVVVFGKEGRFTDGFDNVGNFKGQASFANRIVPQECGNTATPFGAIELAQSQILASRLALESLAGQLKGNTWRTSMADDSVVRAAQGGWTPYWLNNRGQPPRCGGVSESVWNFDD